MSSPSKNQNLSPTETQPTNGPFHAVCNILLKVMKSSAEAEVEGLFLNGQKSTILKTTLEELYHPQPPTPIKNRQLH